MAISDDTAALVAAQLTVAWATRIGEADGGTAGTIGPNLVQVYRNFLEDVRAPGGDIDEWLASMRD